MTTKSYGKYLKHFDRATKMSETSYKISDSEITTAAMISRIALMVYKWILTDGFIKSLYNTLINGVFKKIVIIY